MRTLSAQGMGRHWLWATNSLGVFEERERALSRNALGEGSLMGEVYQGPGGRTKVRTEREEQVRHT